MEISDWGGDGRVVNHQQLKRGHRASRKQVRRKVSLESKKTMSRGARGALWGTAQRQEGGQCSARRPGGSRDNARKEQHESALFEEEKRAGFITKNEYQ